LFQRKNTLVTNTKKLNTSDSYPTHADDIFHPIIGKIKVVKTKNATPMRSLLKDLSDCEQGIIGRVQQLRRAFLFLHKRRAVEETQ